LLGDQTLGASDIRAGHCAGMAQPLWMAENALVSDGPNPSANCDLRMAYPVVETSQGGYIAASTRHRKRGLEEAVAAGMPSASAGAECTMLVSEVMAVLLKQMASKKLRGMRTKQINRLRTNTCAMDGSFLSDSSSLTSTRSVGVLNYLGLFAIGGFAFIITFLSAPPVWRLLLRSYLSMISSMKRQKKSEQTGDVERADHPMEKKIMPLVASRLYNTTNNELGDKLDALEAKLDRMLDPHKARIEAAIKMETAALHLQAATRGCLSRHNSSTPSSPIPSTSPIQNRKKSQNPVSV